MTVIDDLNEVLHQAIEHGEVAGASLLVTQHGEERWYAEAGLRNVTTNAPITRDTIFRLYSQTKPVTAVAAMMLVEWGLLDLGEPVKNYLPGFVGQQSENAVPVERDVTIKDLLTMTSGLSYPDETHEAGRAAARVYEELDQRLAPSGTTSLMSTVEFANKLGQQPLHFQPGTRWMYGTSADVMGAIIEVASGVTFGEFLRREIFEPLGMHDTGFFVDNSKLNRLAATYDNPENPQYPQNQGSKTPLREAPSNHLGVLYRPDTEPAFQSGGAGLFSTLDNYSAFATMLLHGGVCGKHRFLSPMTIEVMMQNALLEAHLRDYTTWQTGYGYNSFMRILQYPGQASVLGSRGEYGWDGWLGTYFCNDPAHDATILVMTQLTNAGTLPFTRKVKNIVARALS